MRRGFGIRWWLTLAFALIAAVTAVAVFELFALRSEGAFRARAQELAAGNALQAAIELARADEGPQLARALENVARRRRLAVFVYDHDGRLTSASRSRNVSESIRLRDEAQLHPVAQAAVRESEFGGEAVAGSVGGAVAGALLAFLFGVIGWVEPLGHVLALALAGVLLGALTGAAAGVLLSLARPPRSPPIVALRADIYTVAVEPSFAGRATVALVRGHATQVGPPGW